MWPMTVASPYAKHRAKNRRITMQQPTDSGSRNGRGHTFTRLAERLGYDDLDFTMSAGVQARLAAYAELERKEVQQHGRVRILRFRLGGER
jgi:hypothetical protein